MSQLSFSRHVGIDVSQSKLDVHCLPENEHFQVPNTPKGIQSLQKKLAPYKEQTAIILEATGGYERLALSQLSMRGFSVCLVNPLLVYHFRKSLAIAAKTDRVDARVLALFAQSRTDLRYGLYDKEQQAIQDLYRTYAQLKKVYAQEKNRLKQAHYASCVKAHQSIIKCLEKQMAKLEQKIKDRISQNDVYAQQYQLLNSIKGIADKIAIALICSLPEMGRISHKALIRLVGVAPINKDSGTMRGKRCIQGGRQQARDALYIAALVATQYDPVIRAYYLRKQAEGKKKKVALVACMAKMVRIVNSVIANQQPYVCPQQ